MWKCLTTNIPGEVTNSVQELHHLSRWEKPAAGSEPQSGSTGGAQGQGPSGHLWGASLLNCSSLWHCSAAGLVWAFFLFFMNDIHLGSQPSLPGLQHEGKRTGMFTSTLGAREGTLPMVRGLKIRKCSWGVVGRDAVG